MPPQLRAILWAQWRSIWNRTGEGLAGRVLAALLAVLWYGLWTGLAVTAAVVLDEAPLEDLRKSLPWALMAVFLYWQLAPILTASLGAALDLKKLLVYPVAEPQLFFIEVVLKLTTGLEMLLVLTGTAVGLLRNPEVPLWGPLVALPLYAVFNLLLAAGLSSVLDRLLSQKYVREAVFFLLVLSAALPQLIAISGGPPPFVRRTFAESPWIGWPWASLGALALGAATPISLALTILWLAGAYEFGVWQFHRSLRFDHWAVAPVATRSVRGAAWSDWFYRLPARLFPDPLAAIVEKELRTLFRSPRFRLVFLMGFSFGFLIWLPLFRLHGRGLSSENYPVFVSVYALLLLSEVVFWNVFGLDRSAVQLYLTAPIPLSRILVGKNLAGLMLVVLEVTVVLAVCAVLPVPLRPLKILEVYSVTVTLCIYLFALGNLSSVYYPRPVNPEQSWGRASSGKFQMVLLLLYPLISGPVLLAYAARFAFESELAFYGVLVVAALVGAAVYWVALDSALGAAESRMERLIQALSQAAGPVVAQ